MHWPWNLRKKIKRNEQLAKYTTFKIGGRAKFYLEPANSQELSQAVIFAKKNRIPIFLMGGGSNLLISDRGIAGLVIRLVSPAFTKVTAKGNYLEAGSGVKLSRLFLTAKNNRLAKAEFLAGIPGTLGGALFMNAGAWGRSIADIVEEIKVMDYNGKISLLNKEKLKFGYRKSNLRNFLVLGAKLRLQPAVESLISRRIKKYLLLRKNGQENRFPNAGCIFKNPEKLSAGKLIDLCGLKAKKIGDAQISSKHANFIINRGHAKGSDVLRLMQVIKVAVKRKFKVSLSPEIRIWQ